jgi:homoserine O-acetyltransferase
VIAAVEGSSSRGHAPLPSPLRLRRGGELQGGVIAWESWGAPSAARDNTVLLYTGLSPSAHAASSTEDPSPGWWEPLIGAGRALDTDRYHVVCVNSLGSCFGSTGAASIDPRTGRRYGRDFPTLSLEDIAQGGRAVLDHLGIARAHTVAGASQGGMVVLAHAALFPGGARHLLSISGTAAATPHALALRSIQRDAVTADPAFCDGDYPPGDPPRAGLALARKVGTVTYRSAEELLARFGRRASLEGRDFAVQDYLAQQAARFADRFDANCYLRLSRAMDLFDLADHGEPVEVLRRAGLGSALVIGVRRDALFTLAEQASLAATLRAAGIATEFIELDSLAGHDAFLVDFATFDTLLRPWFAARAPRDSRTGPAVTDTPTGPTGPAGPGGPAPNDT